MDSKDLHAVEGVLFCCDHEGALLGRTIQKVGCHDYFIYISDVCQLSDCKHIIFLCLALPHAREKKLRQSLSHTVHDRETEDESITRSAYCELQLLLILSREERVVSSRF